MGDEKAAAMLPEKGPYLFAISARQRQRFEIGFGGPTEGAFLMLGRQLGEAGLYLEEKHQPMGVALIAVFTDEAGEVQIGRGEVQAGFFVRLSNSAGVRALSEIRTQLASGRAETTTIGLMPPFHQ